MEDLARIKLFQAYGVELEYMIVDQDTLAVKPVANKLFKDLLGREGNEIEYPVVSLSNELALHIVEMKTTQPTADLSNLKDAFHKMVMHLNERLNQFGAKLLPTAAHPFMKPHKETRLWPNENSEIYQTYDRIFSCKGHGWSNLQSTHINLPFANDHEFEKLHAAIRIILPLIPALCASSPILGGKKTGYYDTRLRYYQQNQKLIPSICGDVIPEPIFTEADYKAQVFDRIKQDLKPFDTLEILEPIWVNSRGAIARFDRGAIEIRLIDIQESVSSDLAIVCLITEAIKMLVSGRMIPLEEQKKVPTNQLVSILQSTIKDGNKAILTECAYLSIFGLEHTSRDVKGRDVWQRILEDLLKNNNRTLEDWKVPLTVLLDQGTLSHRILKAIDGKPTKKKLQKVYDHLSRCLHYDQMFLV